MTLGRLLVATFVWFGLATLVGARDAVTLGVGLLSLVSTIGVCWALCAPGRSVQGAQIVAAGAAVLTAAMLVFCDAGTFKGPFAPLVAHAADGSPWRDGRPLQANSVAMLAAPAAMAAAVIASASRNRASALSWCGLAAALVLVVAATGSRTGVLALFVGSLCFILARSSVAWICPALPLISAVGVLLEHADVAVAGRLDQWAQLLPVVINAGIMGLGFGNLPYVEQAMSTSSPPPVSAHNLLLQSAADFGPIGTLLISALIVMGMWRTWRRRRSSVSAELGLVLLVTSLAAGVTESLMVITLSAGTTFISIVTPLPLICIALAIGSGD